MMEEKKRILCYGDSNTYGYDPRDGGRYPKDARWPDLTAELLGPTYELMADGMNGRSIDISGRPEGDASGRAFARRLEKFGMPDLLVLMLGTNNALANQKEEKITQGLLRMAKQVDRRVLIVSPVIIRENAPFCMPYLESQREICIHLIRDFHDMAKENGYAFLDLNQYIKPSNWDGVHLEPDGHRKLASVMADTIKSIFE